MRQRIPEHVPLALERRVHHEHARDAVHHAVIQHIDLAGAGRDAELHVEDQQEHQAEHEDRDGLARQADHAHHMVEARTLTRRRDHAERDADHDGKR